ncbi:G-type lectin S-receptor-like serine/threonine-protein kinase LECRK3 [Cinnamomum micranthum f. kanehirae]|uniref:Receptor-like serine/threonine-protein kinase n=1 Tax=Cinnamomum micranthum f. kanehirae TaxID=337451 RepID=A0A3S3PTU6_9MAGN|nr:G-type lectin S-receptor-like serine/threonine-protein kinase LECRK3 [Cinnamomum micranthum f. kanehirae]
MASSASSSSSLFFRLSILSWLFLLLPYSSLSQPSNNITLGSSLSTLQANPSWHSPSGEFAFGLYRLPNQNLFLLAVWLDKIPERTVVWTAKGDSPVQRGSRVELTRNGQLVLYDNLGAETWKANVTGPVAFAASAAMLDTGEFVLKSSNSSRIWGTFDNPTDTLLPTQKLAQNSSIFSRRAEDDYSNGKFQLFLQFDNLAIYIVNVPTGAIYNTSIGVTYNVLISGVFPISSAFLYNGDTVASRSLGRGYQLVFDEKGYIGMLQRNGSIFNLTWGEIFPTREFYHRATMDIDGVFRQYVYRKTGRSSWVIAGAIPSDICTAIISYPGSGVCGFNSYCKLDANQKPRCECPTGYSYSKPNNTLEGCKPDFTPQTCNSVGVSNEQVVYDMKEMPNTTWIVSDFEQYSPVDEVFCKSSCLKDCMCAIAIFDNGTCLKKRLPISNGRAGPSIKAKTLVKVPQSTVSLASPDLCRGKKDKEKLVHVGSALLGGSGFLNFFFVAAICLTIYYSYHKKLLRIHDDPSLLRLNLRSFTFKQLEEATHGFKEELGRGGFGTVFKGFLTSDSSNIIAVKRLDRVVQETEREFKTEVSVIGQTHHKNLVRLLGFCDEGSHRLLVYEFMSNGSLASFLFDNLRPNWSHRCQIAIGIARGLMYLHEECSTQIIHCDIKPQNILLDDNFVARISDFGLAKLLKTDQTRTSTVIRGTRGYLAPEWFKNLSVTVKVDIYSFGIVLLEIICCRKHMEVKMGHEEEVILKDWAYRCYREGRLDLLMGEDEEAMKDRKVLERMVMVAIWCVQDDPSLRPSMKRVVRMMSGVVDVSVPMDPCFSSRGD